MRRIRGSGALTPQGSRIYRSTLRVLGAIAGFDMVIIETTGIGQSDSEIVDLVDYSVYVMTSAYGAANQLEKIDMIDFADMGVLNKFDKRSAEDALRDVRKQWRRNHNEFALAEEQIPVYPTIASQFNDLGVNWVFHNLCTRMSAKLKLELALDAGDRHHAARSEAGGALRGGRELPPQYEGPDSFGRVPASRHMFP